MIMPGVSVSTRSDHARCKCLHTELEQLSCELSMFIHIAGNIVLPNPTPDQPIAIYRVAKKIVKSTNTKAWETRALIKLIRVVSFSPHNWTVEFSRRTRFDDVSQKQPPCTCHQLAHPERYGSFRCLTLIPISVSHLPGSPLRPRDPLLVTGRQARKIAVLAPERFVSQVQGSVLDLQNFLPGGLFSECGTLLHTMRNTVDTVSKHMYARVVDKGAGELWGFYQHWLWGKTEEFLRKEKYLTSTSTPEQVVAETTALIKEKGWHANPRARFCVLYIIGKAKSLQKGQLLWRPIAAYPNHKSGSAICAQPR